MRLSRPTDLDIGRHLLREEGEVIVDVVHHHWAAYTIPLLESALAVLMLGAHLGGARCSSRPCRS